jgi:sugar/nucleoside kinase (ribokinase family)
LAAKRVVGLGLCVVDHLYRVERLDLAAERTRYDVRRVASGGMVATALAQAARLGCPAHLLSVVGDDAEGRTLRRVLRAAGVRTRRLILCPDLPTTVAVVLVARRGGERRFLVPDRRGLERAAPELDLAPIGRGAILIVDGHFPRQALRAVQRARERGATVIADLCDTRPSHLALLPYVDHPVVPRGFAEAFAGPDPRDTLRQLARRFGGAPVVTLGRRGGVYLEGGRVRRYLAPRVRAVDTTGAGDVFHGAFAAGLAHGLEPARALEVAALAAARACTAFGGAARLSAPRDVGLTRRIRAGAGARAAPGRGPRAR